MVKKNSILQIDHTNQLIAKGMERHEALIQASRDRLRPILMTTGAMVLGTIPLALAAGAGAEARQAIGWVIVGGLTFGRFFTLFVVPVAYTLIAAKFSESIDQQLSDQGPKPTGAHGSAPAE